MVWVNQLVNTSLHLKNIYVTEELNKESTTEEFSIVQQEGNRSITRSVLFYNLEAIISVGYRVNSERGIASTALDLSNSMVEYGLYG